MDLIYGKYNYWIYMVLLGIGLYGMIAKNNLMKKVIGMTIFQTSIILFYVSIGVKERAHIPILRHDHHHYPAPEHIEPALYANPLPHVLMLTAIVVGVGTLSVALALLQKIFREYRTIEEHEVLERIE